MRGGARPGSGRPRMAEEEKRKMRATRATDDEWEVIREFSQLTKKLGVDKARAAVERMKTE